jgi:hypothetical protein
MQIGCSTSTEPDSDNAPLRILILPHSAQIHEGELLVCKVTLHNQGVDTLIFERAPSDELGSIVWEIRKRGDHEYSRIITRWTFSHRHLFPSASVCSILPGQNYVTFDSLFPSGRPDQFQPFVEAGTYEIRAAFDLAGQRIVSRPAEVLVTPAFPSERAGVHSAAALLDTFLAGNGVDRKKLTECERNLSPSQLKTILQWLLAVLAAETDADPQAHAQATLLRNQVPPVIAEALELKVVQHLMNLNKWSAADRLLERITTPSYDRDSFKTVYMQDLKFPTQK